MLRKAMENLWMSVCVLMACIPVLFVGAALLS